MQSWMRGAACACLALALMVTGACDNGGSDDEFGPSVPQNLSLTFTNYNPHVGQLFKVRVVDAETGEQTGCAVVPVVPAPTFTVDLSGTLFVGRTYNIEFYADLNMSGGYTPPDPGPVFLDHSWRLTVGPVDERVDITFPHDANWVDIQFPDNLCN